MDQQVKAEPNFAGKRILVVDDEFIIALSLEDTFSDAGAQVISASTLSMALQSARQADLSAAILDFRLGNDTSEAVAEVLSDRGIPFLFYSGQALPDRVKTRYPAVLVLQKPVTHATFLQAMDSLLH